MKAISGPLLAHMQGEVTTLNTCVLVTRVDGTKFGYTDCDADLTVSGQLYKSAVGITATKAETSDAMNVDQIEVSGYLDSSTMTEADVMAGKWDDAAVSVFMINRASPSTGVYHVRDGVLGQMTLMSNGQFHAEMRGLTQYLQKQIGTLITPTCRWTLGDVNSAGSVPGSHCTVNLSALGVAGVAVTSVVNSQSFAASSLGQPVGYFQAGYLKWTSGANNGRSMDVQAHGSSGALVLELPMLNTVAIGDHFTIYPGCQKRYSQDCVAKFANGINFGGFPYVPGLDKMMRPGGV